MVALERKIATLSKLVGSSPEGSEVGGTGFDAVDEEEEGRKVIKGRGRAATREVEWGEQNYVNSGGWGEGGDGGEEEDGNRRRDDGAVESCVREKGNGQSMQQPKELCEDETTTTTSTPMAKRNDAITEEGEGGEGGEGDGVSARVSVSAGEEADGGKVGGNGSKKTEVLGEKSGKANKKTAGKKMGGKPFVKPLHPQQQQRKERRKGHPGRRGELRSEDGETYVFD
jgi:hypothetical protein